jgi:tRNA G18 (ribose-2'-O)-methylase SpoU
MSVGARIERVRAADDPRLHDFVQLRDVQLRSVLEPAEGLFLAEGEKTIRRAAMAGFRCRAILLAARFVEPLADLLSTVEAPVLVADDAVIEATAGFPVHRGALASFERRPLPPPEDVLTDARRVVVLEDLADHTNVGLVFRSAAALGFDAVLATPRCADPLYRRAVKTSMGAVFQVPWSRLAWREGPEVLRVCGFTLVTLTPARDAVPIDAIDRSQDARLAVALGGEGRGLSGHWLRAADVRARIPMRDGVDSLNVAAAAAIAFHVLGTR